MKEIIVHDKKQIFLSASEFIHNFLKFSFSINIVLKDILWLSAFEKGTVATLITITDTDKHLLDGFFSLMKRRVFNQQHYLSKACLARAKAPQTPALSPNPGDTI